MGRAYPLHLSPPPIFLGTNFLPEMGGPVWGLGSEEVGLSKSLALGGPFVRLVGLCCVFPF